MDNKEKMIAGLIAVVLVFISLSFMIALSGFVLMKLWLWFIVPLGVLPLSIFHAFGIATVASFFKIGIAQSIELKLLDKELNPVSLIFEQLFTSVFGLIFILGLGYIFHLMM
jgi:hypothetical protein